MSWARTVVLVGAGHAHLYVAAHAEALVELGARVVLIDPGEFWYSGLPVKPIENLWKLRQHLEGRFAAGEAPRVAVVGGGPTGSEVAANLAALATRHGLEMQVTLITHGNRLIEQAPAGAAQALQQKLARGGVSILLRTRIIVREGNALIAKDGSRVRADVVVLAIGLEANPIVECSGLPTRPKHGLRINDTLRSIADERAFASGDSAAMEGFDLPKLGVFGVRQAPYMHANLLASLDGKPLAEYNPRNAILRSSTSATALRWRCGAHCGGAAVSACG